jgi:hypothetical protein
MRNLVLSAALSVLAAAAPAAAQQPHVQNFKDPGTATVLSVVVPGGGQFYSGETGKGAAILGVGMGGLVLGVGLSGVSCSDSSCSTHTAPLLLGSLAYLGAWIYGIADAGHSAERMNTLHGIARLTRGATPTVAHAAGGGTAVGVSLRL